MDEGEEGGEGVRGEMDEGEEGGEGVRERGN